MFEYSRKQSSSFSFVSVIPYMVVLGMVLAAMHVAFGQ